MLPRQGLTRQVLIQAALHLIEERGYASFSMGELAKYLHVRPASLYNHIENLDTLYTEVGLAAISQMVGAEKEAIEGKSGDEALRALADAYYTFATTHYELYMVIMKLPHSQNHVLEIAAGQIIEPIFHVFADFALDDTQKIHWQRILRSMMHGFISHEQCGAFSRFPICRSTTYQMAIQCILDGLHAAGKEHDENR